VSEYLPAALLHLREAEIVRLCGLARAARGQEYARKARVEQPEREAGTLRATVLEGEAASTALARFSDAGLETWECSCSSLHAPSADGAALSAPMPCEHIAALLYAWVRAAAQFRLAGAPPQPVHPSASDRPQAPAAQPAAAPPQAGSQPQPQQPEAQKAPAPAPEPLSARLERLDQTSRRLLDALTLAGGSVTEREALRLFARLELGTPEDARTALERLRQRGLILPVLTAAPPARAPAPAEPAGWSLPDDLLAALPRSLPLLPLLPSSDAVNEGQQPEARAAPEGAPVGSPQASTKPACAGWDGRQLRGGAAVGQLSGGWPSEGASSGAALPALLLLVAAQMVDRAASAPDAAPAQKPALRSALDLDAALALPWAQQLDTSPEQVRFCLALLRLAGFAPPAASDARASETLLRAYQFLLGRRPAEVLRDLFSQWLHAHSVQELLDLRDAGVRVAWLSRRETRHTPDIAAENQAARQFVVDLLRWVPAGCWWSFSSLIDFCWRFRPDFLQGRQQTFLRPQWWLERLPGGQPLSLEVRAEWRQGEGRYIALLFRRALRWLGIVDLALDAQGRLKGFRITPLGSFLLGTVATVDEAAQASRPLPEALRPLEDGALLAPLDALSEGALETLLCWCAPAGATAAGLRFLPSAERVAASLDAGHNLEEWLALLEQSPRRTAFDPLIAQLRRWAGVYGQVQVYESATLLEVASPALWRELEVTLHLSEQYSDHLLAPGLAVLRPETVEPLAGELRRRGYTPWMIDDETADRS
jgi:hypothetical protein